MTCIIKFLNPFFVLAGITHTLKAFIMKKASILLFSFIAILFHDLHGQGCNSLFAVFSPDGNYIYFVSDRDSSDWEIYRMDSNGQNIERLTYSEAPALFPEVSPDGKKVVFAENLYGNQSEIFIMNSDGSHKKQLTDNHIYDGKPSFSPDGKRIIFDAWDESPYPEIFVMDSSGKNRRQITQTSGAWWNSDPCYGKDGRKIYYSIGYNADNHIAVMDSNGMNSTDITDPNTFGTSEGGFHLNPDNTKLIFHTTEWAGYNNGSDIVESNADGSNWKQLTYAADNEYFYYPVYHPISGNIYFSHKYPGKPWQIYRMKADGSDTVRIETCRLSTGTKAFAKKNATRIYPNPADKEIRILADQPFSIRLYDASGRMLLKSNEALINTSKLLPGIYFIELRSKGGQLLKIKKIFIQ